MAINVIVKGPIKSAKRAASRHGVAVSKCHLNRRGEAVCKVPCVNVAKVSRWHGEHARTRAGRGFPPGTLLHWSDSSCPAHIHLGGARRRRRRR